MPLFRVNSVGNRLVLRTSWTFIDMNFMGDQEDYEDGVFSDPVLMYNEGDPRIIDTIFNTSSLTSGIFNNTLFQTAGIIILGIILFGKFNESGDQNLLSQPHKKGNSLH